MILVDTGPLVALSDPRDAHHAIAIEQVAKLAAAGLRVCDAVLTEACFLLPAPSQRARLLALLTELRIDALPTHDAEFRSAAFAWIQRYGEHQPDWADACLAVLSGRNTRLKVWTYDREFRTTWRRPDGRAIPMAVRGA